MKLNFKILTVFLVSILFSVIFCFSSVSAVGRVAQAWIITEGSNGEYYERAMLYRTHVHPHNSVVKKYTNTSSSELLDNGQWTYTTSNNTTATSKWIYNSTIPIPTIETYTTSRLVFHEEMFCDYSNYGSWGYNFSENIIDNNLETVTYTVNNSKHIRTMPKKTGYNGELYSITRIGGTSQYIYYGTNLVLTNLYIGKQTEYRYALINVENSTANVTVTDNIVYKEDLENLVVALNGKTSCYVTNEVISKTIGSRTKYEVSKTAYDFTRQYDKSWVESVKGTTQSGMGAVFNLYDNQIIFPVYSNRKVYIKHINIKSGDTIDITTIDNGLRMTPEENEKYILVGQQKTTSDKSYTGYEEYYEEIGITQSITKNAINLEGDLRCLGYNVGVAADLTSAQNHVTSLVRQGLYTEGETVFVEGKDINSNDDAIVIEFYYTFDEDDEQNGASQDTDEPEKEIGGNIFVESTENIDAVCNDGKQYPVTSIPSGSSVKTGIEKVPQHMAGAVNLENQENAHTLKVNLQLKAGPNIKNVTYTLNYTADYYTITNMLIYKYNGIQIYDANSGYNGTVGDSMFNWTGGTLQDNSLIKPVSVNLYGLNDTVINNSQEAILNESNYVKATLNTSLGNYDVTGASSKNLNKTYLTDTQWKTVDINNDKTIDNKDKEQAQYLVDEAESEKNSASTAKANALRAMNSAKSVLSTKTTTMNNAKSVLSTKTTTMDNAYNAFYEEFGVYPSSEAIQAQAEEIKTLRDEYRECEDTYGWLANIWCSSQETAYKEALKKRTRMQEEYSTYTTYKNEYETAKMDYDVAKSEYDTANTNYNNKVKDYNTASTNYDNKVKAYNTAVSNQKVLLANYDSYLSLYNQYKNTSSMSNANIASQFKITTTVTVRNMQVLIDGNDLYNQVQPITQTISFANSGLAATKYTIATEKPSISKTIYSTLTNTIKRNDYTNSSYVDEDVINGLRGLSGLIKYKAEVIIGDNNNKVKDTLYYDDKSFEVTNGKQITKTYRVNTKAETSEEQYEEVLPVNIYTPITVSSTVVISSNEVIDQTESGSSVPFIQINTPFTIKITNNKRDKTYGIGNTDKYNSGYYIKFDFDVHKVSVDGKSYKNGQRINAGTWIGLLTGDNISVTVQAYGSAEEETLNVISDDKSSYTVRAVAYNATDIIRNTAKLYPTLEEIMASSAASLMDNICAHPSYIAEETNELIIINRMYGFRVTDVKDVEWKNVFRTTSGSTVNKHTGNVYYSGITKWDITSNVNSNKISTRPVSEVGRNPLRVLPIGPYKNTDISKIKAPKLGYRFSYDLKVTGSYYTSNGDIRTDKLVNIKTKFYYISKDGKMFIEESNGGEGIYLFYKNSNGQYVRIDNNGGNYQLKFTPQDGYRYIEDDTIDTLATTAVSLGNLRSLTLKYNMATPTNNRSAITYYGEYKLPNSTIAVKVDANGKYDINNPLINGYIGVVFDITANAGTVIQNGAQTTVALSYDKNTKSEANTSQWDYEGFLGFANYGKTVKAGEVSLKLEAGTWQMTNEIYNKIKGTVVLYDMDQRAATDYE